MKTQTKYLDISTNRVNWFFQAIVALVIAIFAFVQISCTQDRIPNNLPNASGGQVVGMPAGTGGGSGTWGAYPQGGGEPTNGGGGKGQTGDDGWSGWQVGGVAIVSTVSAVIVGYGIKKWIIDRFWGKGAKRKTKKLVEENILNQREATELLEMKNKERGYAYFCIQSMQEAIVQEQKGPSMMGPDRQFVFKNRWLRKDMKWNLAMLIDFCRDEDSGHVQRNSTGYQRLFKKLFEINANKGFARAAVDPKEDPFLAQKQDFCAEDAPEPASTPPALASAALMHEDDARRVLDLAGWSAADINTIMNDVYADESVMQALLKGNNGKAFGPNDNVMHDSDAVNMKWNEYINTFYKQNPITASDLDALKDVLGSKFGGVAKWTHAGAEEYASKWDTVTLKEIKKDGYLVENKTILVERGFRIIDHNIDLDKLLVVAHDPSRNLKYIPIKKVTDYQGDTGWKAKVVRFFNFKDDESLKQKRESYGCIDLRLKDTMAFKKFVAFIVVTNEVKGGELTGNVCATNETVPCGTDNCKYSDPSDSSSQIATRSCSGGTWSNCTSYTRDCGTCCSCDTEGTPEYNTEQDGDCEPTKCDDDTLYVDACGAGGVCESTEFGIWPEQVRNECDDTLETIGKCTQKECKEGITCDNFDGDHDNVSEKCGDCDDSDPKEKPNQEWYKDFDNDGLSDGTKLTQCEKPENYKIASDLTATSGDCDDTNAYQHKSDKEDNCADGQDNDCDGLVDKHDRDCINSCADVDNDDFSPDGGACGPTDCDDTNPSIKPETQELCDGKDTNCDGVIPNDEQNGEIDNDGDGYMECDGDCNDSKADIKPTAAENCSDGIDNDCDGDTDGDDPDCENICVDNDHDGAKVGPVDLCQPQDCDDADANKKPGQKWYKDFDEDTYGKKNGTVLEQCERPANHYLETELAEIDKDCDDNNAEIKPSATEDCGDGIDNDCDGDKDGDDPDCGSLCVDNDGDGAKVGPANCIPRDCDDNDADKKPSQKWYKDFDGDTYGDANASPIVQCEKPANHYLATKLAAIDKDCDDNNGNINPRAHEDCDDNKDHDCDDDMGYRDQDDDCCIDSDGDGHFLAPQCNSGSADCDDTLKNVNPGKTEIPYNGLDDDCDDRTSDVDVDGDGHEAESMGGDDCNDENPAIHPGATEILDNDVDEDCDGVKATTPPPPPANP